MSGPDKTNEEGKEGAEVRKETEIAPSFSERIRGVVHFVRDRLRGAEVARGAGDFSGMFYRNPFIQGNERLRGYCESLKTNPSFLKVLGFWDKIASDLGKGEEGFETAAFFQHESLQVDFLERLMKFDLYVEAKMDELEEKIEKNGDWARFSTNWKDNIKTVCYQAFFTHYGVKRKGEVDDNNSPLDYVYHPMEVAFDILGDQVCVLDERLIVGALLHDTREDAHKGTISLLANRNNKIFKNVAKGSRVEFHKEKALKDRIKPAMPAVLSAMRRFEKDFDQRMIPPRTKDQEGEENVGRLPYLIDLLTKDKERGDRNETFLKLMNAISQGQSEEERLDLFGAFLIKLADRLSNMKSNKVKVMKRSTKADTILDETIYGYLEPALALGMFDLVDRLLDFIEISDWQEYQDAQKRAEMASKLENEQSGVESLKMEFVNRFLSEMKYACGRGRLELEENDVVVEFRPVPLRYSIKRMEEEIKKGQLTTGLRNYVLIYPNSGDKVKDALIAANARQVMFKMFPEQEMDISGREGVIDSALGSKIMEGREYGKSGMGYNRGRLGDSVWHVYDNANDMRAARFGCAHMAMFQHDEEAVKKLMLFLDGVKRDMKGVEGDRGGMIETYRFLRAKVESLSGRFSVNRKRANADPGIPKLAEDLGQLVSYFALSVFNKRLLEVSVVMQRPSVKEDKVKEKVKGSVWVQPDLLMMKSGWLMALLYASREGFFRDISKFEFLPETKDGKEPSKLIISYSTKEASIKEIQSRVSILLDYFSKYRKRLLADDKSSLEWGV